MTNEELAAIRARCEAATPGTWTAICPRISWRIMAGECYVMESEIVRTPADAAFIAHARQDVPALLAEGARLREIIQAGDTPAASPPPG